MKGLRTLQSYFTPAQRVCPDKNTTQVPSQPPPSAPDPPPPSAPDGETTQTQDASVAPDAAA